MAALVFIYGIAFAQAQDTIAIVPPFLDRQQRPEWDGTVRLLDHQVVIHLYQNYAAVYIQALFVNTGTESLEVEIGLPAMGYTVKDEEGKPRDSKGFLGLRLWVERERVVPEIQQSGDDIWYSISPKLAAQQEVTLKALFWVPTTIGQIVSGSVSDTSLIPQGQRTLLMLLGAASMWSELVKSARFTLVLRDGLFMADSMFAVQPKNYDQRDSTLQWSLQDTEPTDEDNIVVRYTTVGASNTPLNSLRRIAEYVGRGGYSTLLEYVQTMEK